MTTSHGTPFRKSRAFQFLYKVGVAVKGFDGLAELVAGLALTFSPSLVHVLLSSIIGEASERQGRAFQIIADNVARVDADFSNNSILFLILFLITHGAIKLALVYALIREITKAYPYALAALILFFVYQAYVLVMHPTVAMALFTLLDAAIIWLVWGEYRDLREKAGEK